MELIGKGNTGNVYKEGNYVYKNSTNSEGEVYRILKGIEGIAKGEREGDFIKTPYYDGFVSIDTVKKEDREDFSTLVGENFERINVAISEMSRRTIYYSDVLQFAVDPLGKFDLIDFSNAIIEWEDSLKDNSYLLENFYSCFCLKKLEEIVREGYRYISLCQWEEPPCFFKDVRYKAIEIRERLGGSPNYCYYARNPRSIHLKGIAHIDEHVYTRGKLSIDDKESWELLRVF